MSDVNIRGRFVWHELMTTDTEAAADFYGKVVGWSTQRWSGDSEYTLFRPAIGPDGVMNSVYSESPDQRCVDQPTTLP